MATGSLPTASSIWRHLPMPPAQSAVPPPPLISDNSRVNAVRTHMTTLNASVEALSSTLTAATTELGEAKREVRALVDLQTEALQNVTGEMTHLVNRCQTAIVDSLGSQSVDVNALAPLIRINYAKIDALDARLSAGESTMRAVQTRFDALERQIADFNSASSMLLGQQAQSISHLTTLVQLFLARASSPPRSPSSTSSRKRARSVTDSGSSSSRLARRREISWPIDDAGLEGYDGLPLRSATGLPESSSFIPREAMPGSFVPRRALVIHPAARPPSPADTPNMPGDPAYSNLPADISTVHAEADYGSARSSVSRLIPGARLHSDSPANRLTTSPRTSTTMATGSEYPIFVAVAPSRPETHAEQQDMDHEDFLDYCTCFNLDCAQMMTVCPVQCSTQIQPKHNLDLMAGF